MHKERFLEIPAEAIPDGITPAALLELGGRLVLRTTTTRFWSVRELPPRDVLRRWTRTLGVVVLGSSWGSLRSALTPSQRKRVFRAKVVREVEGRKLVGFVVERDVLDTDRVLSRGRPPGRRG